MARKWKQEGESIENVFCRFINQAGMHPTKEEWKERVESIDKISPFKILEPEKCNYRVIDPETGKWYCDGKQIVPAVCIGRQERYFWLREKEGNPRIRCKPKDLKKRSFKRSRGTITIPTTTYCYVKKRRFQSGKYAITKKIPANLTPTADP